MRKLIKRYQSGGDFAQDKSQYYPGTTSNTGNIGAMNLATLTGGKTPSFAPKIDIDRLNNLKPNIPNIPIDTAVGKGLFRKIGGLGKKFIGGVGNIAKSMGPGAISMGSNVLSSLLPEATQSKGLQGINTVLGFAENFPVYGKFASLAKLGINALNSFGGHTIATLNNGQEEQDALANTGGGYGDFMADWDEAKQYSGKRAGFFDGNKYDEMVWDANYNMSKLQGVIGQQKINNTLTAQMADRWNERTMMNMNGGPGNIMFGRLGLKVEILPKVHAILNAPKVVDFLTEFKEEVPEFKEGGKMNVIPEGSLHARLHHMENAEGLTKKGIPVVSIAEGGELEQQAEIELNEIIFNLEVTTELEKLMNDGSDNAAIEAGKLLVKEIFENTDDRTGLIKDLEPEKKKSTTEDIVKNHQVFKNGGIIEQIDSLSPDKLEELQKIIKYLNQ